MVELALTAATEQSSIVFALLVPQAKLANKITGMSVLMILARTEDVLTALETTTVHVNQVISAVCLQIVSCLFTKVPIWFLFCLISTS